MYQHKHSEISSQQAKVLVALAEFKFLSIEQMIRLGIAQSSQAIRRTLSPLRPKETENPLINVVDFGFYPGVGRLPYLFFLTKAGAEKVAEIEMISLSEVFYYKNVKFFSRDYFHRVMTIDFHIEVSLFSDQNNLLLSDFLTYFGHSGNNRSITDEIGPLRKDTKVDFDDGTFLIPDIIMEIQDYNGQRYPFAVEIHNEKNEKRIHTQLQKHLHLLATGALSKKLDLPVNPIVLSVFRDNQQLNGAYNRTLVNPSFAKSRQYFAFTTVDKLNNDFENGWMFLDGKRRIVLPRLTTKNTESQNIQDIIDQKFRKPLVINAK